MKKWTTVIIITLVSVLAVQAQGYGNRMGGMSGRGSGRDHGGPGALLNNPRVLEQLDLTDAQESRLRDALYEHQLAMIDLRAEAERAEIELEKAEQSGDRDAVHAAIEKSGATEIEIRKQQADMKHTVEQIVGREKLEELKQEMREKFRENRNQRGYRHDRGDRRERGRHHERDEVD